MIAHVVTPRPPRTSSYEVWMGKQSGRSEQIDTAVLVDIGERARRHAARIVDRDTAEDIAQDLVIDCLERMRAGTWSVRPDGIDAYVGCVVRRRTIDGLRRAQSRAEREAEHARELTEGVHAWMEPELALEARELEALRVRAMAELPEACRRAYLLVREQKASYAEAAAVLGVTTSAVNANVVRAQRKLRARLGERLGRPEPLDAEARRGTERR